MSDPIPLEELASLPTLNHPRVSPDGDRIACFYDGSGRNELCLVDPGTGELAQVSDGEVPREARYPIEWAPDGEAVYYHRDEGGDEQNDVYAYDLGTDEIRPVVENDGQTVLQDVSPDGRNLLYASDAGEQMNLYEFDRERGEHRQVTAYERPVFGAMYDPTAERIAYVANERDDLENRDVYVADLSRGGDRDGGAAAVGGDGVDGTARRLDVNGEGYQAGVTDWTPAGDAVLVTDDETNFSRWGVYDLATDETEWISDGTCDEWAYCVHPEGYVLAGRHDGATQPLVVYDRDWNELAEPFAEGVSWVHGDRRSGMLPDGRILAGQTTPTSRDDLLAYDPAADETTVIREAEYGDIDPDAFVDADYVTYESTDGTDVGAVLYDSGERPSPVIVLVHGGPHGHVDHTFNARVQFLVDRGYTVLAPNFRGSTAYGREFKNAIHGDWGGKEQEDIAAGARWIAEKEWVDEDDLAVFGGSFGGYSAYWQLVRYPDLWDAGIAWVGITDLPGLFEESMAHFKTTLREQMGDPEDNADLWRERSPITHVEDIEAPLLMLHGVNDPRCPVSQAREFRDALEERRGWTEGEEFEYVELGEEGHASTDIDHKIRVYRELADFLDERFPAA
ncbi:prolyl oligopeptidase family serine peptidase [Halosimplex aquaticum]|uniref:Prolyl oligopeptidase family serine peptidase n=1 Tax=Halosimplex aquaticum TaxID=3026162 RepID=A0ABD5XZ67_9EURY|nr:prolyl oligopeptidase family serine peptidase [Halosimplex aquaticum]